MDYQIIHHGGYVGVTGSCHELRLADGAGILVDCGLFQGAEERQAPLEIEFAVAHLRALIVTHVHLDHVGRIPYLLAAGFDGPIFCSEPSARLLPLLLEDALKVGVTRDQRRIEAALQTIERRIVPLAYGRWQPIPLEGDGRLAVRLQPAGHILGSAYVDCKLVQVSGEARIVFSGDLGAPYAPLLAAPKPPYGCDLLVLESTYGDRLHEGRRQRREQLRRLIERCLENRGAILLPAFALGRTQELLCDLEQLIHANRQRFAARDLPWSELEVVLDSPLASRLTDAYRELRRFWDAEAHRRLRAGRAPLGFEQITAIDSHQQHLQTVAYLKKSARPCIVIAASGMCGGGRIVNYLRALLPDPRSDVLFVGYQARGTPGREIQTYGPRGGYVVLDGEKIDIRAGVHTLGGYSAHADQQNLVDFVRRMRRRPARIRLVHGEAEARAALKTRLEEELPGIEISRGRD